MDYFFQDDSNDRRMGQNDIRDVKKDRKGGHFEVNVRNVVTMLEDFSVANSEGVIDKAPQKGSLNGGSNRTSLQVLRRSVRKIGVLGENVILHNIDRAVVYEITVY